MVKRVSRQGNETGCYGQGVIVAALCSLPGYEPLLLPSPIASSFTIKICYQLYQKAKKNASCCARTKRFSGATSIFVLVFLSLSQ